MKIGTIHAKRVALEDKSALFLYDENNKELAKGDITHPNNFATCSYKDLVFVASPFAIQMGEQEIFVTLSSLKNFVLNKKEEK